MSGTLSLIPQSTLEDPNLLPLPLCDLSPSETRLFSMHGNFPMPNKQIPMRFYRGPVCSPAPTSIPLNMISLLPNNNPNFLQFADANDLVMEKTSCASIPPNLLKPTPTKRKFKRKQDLPMGRRARPVSMWHDPVAGRTRVTITKHLLFCNHCKLEFRSKTTYRPQFDHHLVNHKCKDTKRRQYVVGVRHRKCTYNCHPKPLGCIQFVGKKWKKESI